MRVRAGSAVPVAPSWCSGEAGHWKSHRSWRSALRIFIVLTVAIAAGGVNAAVGLSLAEASATDCYSTAYACTPGYTGGNASGTWSWKYYGGTWAQTPNGYHNCTLYAAWRLGQAGMGDPGRSWGNAVDWAASIGNGDHLPAVGSVAWWGSEKGGGYGHVAYVEQVSGGNVYIRADNYSTTAGYTDAGWIAASSVDLFLHPHDGGGGISEGAFVSYQGNVYRIAGGAPVYVSTWNAFGGAQPTQALTDQQWASLRQYPADGTFVRGTARGEIYRFAGGAPLYVSTWNAFGGGQPTVDVDQAALDNAGAGGVWNHVRYLPADGTFVRGTARGEIYRFAGGAPLYVSTWDAFGGGQPTVDVDQAALDNAGGGVPWSHARYQPADGTFVVGAQRGEVYRFAGGAPLYVGTWDAFGGAQPTTTVDQAALDSAGGGVPWSHARYSPADGTFVSGGQTGQVYRIAGGAPLYVSSWSIFGGSQPTTTVDQGDIDNAGAGGIWNHLSHLPADHTVLQGLPSGQYWVVNGGTRSPSGASSAAIGVDDNAVAQIPLPATRYEEPAATFDGWSVVSDPSANGGTWRSSATTGNTASFSFTGSSVSWVSRQAPQQGIAALTLDGVSKGTVDLYGTTAQSFSKTFTGLSATGTHTLTIKVTGTKNAASTGKAVVVDAFVVGATTTQESAQKVKYDTWKGYLSVNASGGNYRSSGTAGATATFTFTGTGVDWITSTGPGWGKAEVYVDGVDKGTVDLYAATTTWQVAKSYSGLAAGSHRIMVKALGTKNAAARVTTVPVDGFVVH